ncbi:MAG TPA: MAPEG family protein [Gammaproteobacteria bacterium]|nr:MAPEG family protein [Gammaproteobacteria bacterium]
MQADAIFTPMLLLVFWTFAIMLLMGYKRFSATLTGRTKAGYFKLGESDKVPYDVRVVGRNFVNLFEMPVLFYVLCVSVYVTNQATHALVFLAWCYAALRIVHSLIHILYNNVLHRFLAYATSCLLLLFMWIVFAVNLHNASGIARFWPFH